MSNKERAVILAVDDAPEILDIIKATLADEYDIKLATRGEVALKIAEKQQPDLILLDVMMPGIDGYETCRELKKNPATAHIPVIMVSAGSQMNDELLGLEAGAIDYITKPISTSILEARVRNQISLIFTRRELEKAHNKISEERVGLEQIVYKMRSNSEFDNRKVRYSSKSAEINSGDLVLSAFTPKGEQYVLVTDFTGHGLPAAIGSPLVTYIFYARSKENIPLANIITEINSILKGLLPTHIFMGLIGVSLSSDRRQVQLWNYGMEDILIHNADNTWTELASKNIALGILPEIDKAAHYEIAFQDKQFIYLLTDGITEAFDVENSADMFGVERLKSALIENKAQGKSLDDLVNSITLFAKSPGDFDDMTLLELS